MILAIDLGTTACKSVVIDDACAIVDRESREYSFSTPRHGWAEHDPAEWWDAVSSSIRALAGRVGKSRISVIGLCGQMHGLVALDAAGRPIRPAVLWNDQRSSRQCAAIYDAVGGRAGLLALTNNAMLPGYVGGKLLWLRDNEGESYRRIAKVLLPKDYVRYRLVGEYATDFSDASGTGLFDVRTRSWSSALLEAIGVSGSILPPAFASDEVLGEVMPAVADELGLERGTKVVAGGGDAVIQTVGAGTLAVGDVLAIIGTGGNVTMTVPSCPDSPAPSAQVFCHAVRGKWVTMGVTLNAGNSLKWFKDAFGVAGETADAYARLSSEAEASPPGANGLVFLPYLQGERCPHTDGKARGCFVGIGLETRRQDFVRSIMEGVAFSLYDAFTAIRPKDQSLSRLVVSGGGASSPQWLQIFADVFDCEVITKRAGTEACAVGAGIVAGAAIGAWGSVEEGAALVADKGALPPRAEGADRYKEVFGVYRSLYPELSRSFAAIADMELRR
jgi:xylulokinase